MTNDVSIQDSDYDGAWKEALRRYFPEILQCYCPGVAATIHTAAGTGLLLEAGRTVSR